MDADLVSKGVRSMFYMVTPNESLFQNLEDVPPYVQQATPYFMGLMLLELVLGFLKTGRLVGNVGDGITSVSAGIVSRLPGLFMRGMELNAYVYVWNHFRLVELSWDSVWIWWLTFLGVDFCYYWVHRFAHEMNILWAAHQVHHSSEYYNLSTALRQSLTQQFSSWIFYLPMALAVPPNVFAVHIQFNLLYQFWIHTEVITDLGPLEWVLNTPSHHRVHHGRNLYCIDTNYGGALIIWDRLFGTFAPETDKVVYGLVHPINTFEILTIQFLYYKYVWRRFRHYVKLPNKLSVLFKGPSWKPGKPRLGDHAEVPAVTRDELPHNSSWPWTMQLYVVIQFLLVLGVYQDLFATKPMLSQLTILAMTGYILLTLTSIGFLIEQRPTAPVLEMLRCVVMVMMQRYGYLKGLPTSLAVPIEAFVSLSLLYWGLHSFSRIASFKNKAD
ncbi:alkylglycerol monooxygenase [Aplochiton taeniatus]